MISAAFIVTTVALLSVSAIPFDSPGDTTGDIYQ